MSSGGDVPDEQFGIFLVGSCKYKSTIFWYVKSAYFGKCWERCHIQLKKLLRVCNPLFFIIISIKLIILVGLVAI